MRFFEQLYAQHTGLFWFMSFALLKFFWKYVVFHALELSKSPSGNSKAFIECHPNLTHSIFG